MDPEKINFQKQISDSDGATYTSVELYRCDNFETDKNNCKSTPEIDAYLEEYDPALYIFFS